MEASLAELEAWLAALDAVLTAAELEAELVGLDAVEAAL